MADLPQSVLYADPSALRSARLAALFDLWQSSRGQADGERRAHPGLQAIDPIDLKPFLKDLIVVCVHDPDRPRIRLMGSGFREFFGGDYSGKAVDEAPLGGSDRLGGTCRQVALTDQPRFGRHWWPSCVGGVYQSEFAVLPYGEGTKVERLLIMEDLDEARRARIVGRRRPTS